MNPYQVVLTDSACRDLLEIEQWIRFQEGPAKAEHVVDSILDQIESLRTHPTRGVWPFELEGMGIRDYREIFFKPYRILYRVDADRVAIMLIADGRLNMSQLLMKRLLGG